MSTARLRVLCLWLADSAAILLSWFVAVNVYKLSGLGEYHTTAYLQVWPVALVFTAINSTARLYQGRASYPSLPLPPVEEFRRLVLSAFATHVLVIAFLGFGHRAEGISRVVLVASGMLTALAAQPFRDLVRKLLWKLDIGQIPAVAVGDGRAGKLALKTFESNPYYGKSYEIFSSVKPGITGLWQASGRSDCDYDERVALDVHYVLNWSPWMDLWVIYRTIAAVLKMKGSY